MCAAFIAALPEGWVAYPETGGFDIVLLRSADGFQIGIPVNFGQIEADFEKWRRPQEGLLL